MVGPAAGLVAARAAPAMAKFGGASARSMGGKMMHSSSPAIRSTGSGLLKTKDAKILETLLVMKRDTKTGVAYQAEIAGYLGKIAKHSPALAQQMTIIQKSIGLFWRPIGDIMAKFVRPFAVWGLKTMMLWYRVLNRLTGGSGENNESKGSILDLIESLESELTTAEASGDTNRVKEINDELGILRAKLEEMPDLGKVWKNFGEDVIGDGSKSIADWFTGWGEVFSEWAKIVWHEYIVPGWEGVKEWSQNIWDEYVTAGFEGMKTWTSDLWSKYVSEPWKGVKNWVPNLWKDHIVPGWEGVKNWASDIWVMIKGAFNDLVDRIRGLIPFGLGGGSDAGGATGGYVEKTGVYKLHAGETILRAGETSEIKNSSHSSGGTNITNHINIQASISSDADIRDLANRLAEYQETQLRRRGSYL